MSRRGCMEFKFLNGALCGYRPFAVVGLANLPDLFRYAVNFDIILDILVRVDGSGEVPVCLAAAAASCAMRKLCYRSRSGHVRSARAWLEITS